MKRVTIADVAARAGVSKSTVSHALSGKRPISAATRQRVLHAAEALGYHPNPVAQRLAGGRTNTIGYVFPLYGPYIAGLEIKFIASTANAINKAEYAFMLLTHQADDVDSLRRFVSSGLVDGIILMQVRMNDPRVTLLQQAGIPFVLVGRCADNERLAYVDIDVSGAIDQSVRHLVNLGHRHIGYLYQDDSDFGFTYRARRAFRDSCAARQVPLVAFPCGLSFESGAAAARKLHAQHPEVTAIITWNNSAAWGAFDMLRGVGLQVPEDMSIISFGHSSFSYPTPLPLTVVDIHPEQLAETAAQLLLDMLSGVATAPQALIESTLIVRQSTAAPATDGRDVTAASGANSALST